MTADDLLCALELPEAARVDRRVAKKLLLEHGVATPTDRKQIQEGIEEIRWHAILKPGDAGAQAHRSDAREYLELAVLRMELREGAKATRLSQLFHRAVPYPMLLVTEQEGTVGISAAHLRRSRAQEDAWVLDGDMVRIELDVAADAPYLPALAGALALSEQPRTDLLAVYQGWIDAMGALLAARLSHHYERFASMERNRQRWDALREFEATASEIAKLRRAASRERQMNRQVELNLRIRELEAQRDVALERL
ncbi:MAG: DUF4391 domain-containing protein [Gemmatimonadales bacterium]|nr:MAG: DUF4391 domain-containing protein [Gemmatimonadales bacterium]